MPGLIMAASHVVSVASKAWYLCVILFCLFCFRSSTNAFGTAKAIAGATCAAVAICNLSALARDAAFPVSNVALGMCIVLFITNT